MYVCEVLTSEPVVILAYSSKSLHHLQGVLVAGVLRCDIVVRDAEFPSISISKESHSKLCIVVLCVGVNVHQYSSPSNVLS